MRIGSRIEYQTGVVDFGIGVVAAYDDETEMVTVIDEDYGSTWRGRADQTVPLDD